MPLFVLLAGANPASAEGRGARSRAKKLLEEIGTEWVLRKPYVPWAMRFDLLKRFKQLEGRCNVPKLHKEDGAS